MIVSGLSRDVNRLAMALKVVGADESWLDAMRSGLYQEPEAIAAVTRP